MKMQQTQPLFMMLTIPIQATIPMQMVFPISDQLHDRVEGTDYEAEAVAAASLAEFRIVTAAQTMNDRPNPAEPG